MKRIERKVREAFSGCSSGAKYYDTKGDAVHAFDAALEGCDGHLDTMGCNDWYGDEGSTLCMIRRDDPDYGDCIGYAKFTWYRVGSGRWEIIGYIT
jgi:hypothetical protein